MDIYQALFQNAPDPVLVADQGGRIVEINAEAAKAFGYLPEELKGFPIETLIPSRFAMRHENHRAGFMAHPRTRAMGSELALFALRKDGSEFPVDIMLSRTESDQGPLVIVFLRDTTERKAAAAELRGLQEHLQLSAESAGLGYWTFDEATDQFICDERFATLFGGVPVDFRTAESVRERILPEDRDSRRMKVLESLDSRGRYESEFRVMLPDGTTRWIGDLGRHIGGDGDAKRRISGVSLDITSRKAAQAEAEQARQREKELLELAPIGFFLADLEGKFTDVNAAGCDLLGMDREAILSMSVADLIPPMEIEKLALSKEKLMTGEVMTSEWHLRHRDGSFIPVEVSARIANASGTRAEPGSRWRLTSTNVPRRISAMASAQPVWRNSTRT